ncbi:MAG: DUF2069 domain-containing protein [Gammaproteobacteria bacterium]|jgi:uncharacterized membrane protein|nr:DUF2069 domain-containing protein [Gammaproteobacteria bacterium]MBT7603526.1 DUF2069 domain-containing protein [Gammaproteobacteria bacterium]
MSKLIIYEYITYICLILLIIFIAVWNSIIDPSENIPRILPTIIYNIPLLVVMNKLKKNKFSTYIMTSYVMLLYFVVGVGNLAVENTKFLGTTITILSLIIFISSIFYVREKKSKINNIR